MFENFGKKLKKLRGEKGITQKKIADLLEITQTYYNLLENGKEKKPSNRLLKRLGSYYELPVDFFRDDFSETAFRMNEPKADYNVRDAGTDTTHPESADEIDILIEELTILKIQSQVRKKEAEIEMHRLESELYEKRIALAKKRKLVIK